MMKKTLVSIVLCCFLAIISCSFALPVMAKNKAEIVDVKISRDHGNISVSFRIEDCFTPKMEEAIKNGVATTFRIRVVLERAGASFFRPQILDIVLEHSIKYDRLKNEYRVKLPEHPDRMSIAHDFEEAKRLMATVNDLPVIPAWRLNKDKGYTLRLKAELSKVQLPVFLRYIFFFVSLWDFESDWHNADFSG